jgi:hypothetical protein
LDFEVDRVPLLHLLGPIIHSICVSLYVRVVCHCQS